MSPALMRERVNKKRKFLRKFALLFVYVNCANLLTPYPLILKPRNFALQNFLTLFDEICILIV